jgi:lactoylglutathione lyase
MHIQHITFRVRDLEKSVKFYETIPELKVGRRINAGPASIAFMTNGEGETEVELLNIQDGPTFEGRGMFICFATEKLEEQHRLATELGLNPSPIQDPGDQTRYFYVYDPDGVSVQLRSFPG